MIYHCNHYTFIILVLFTVLFYHFLFSRYLGLSKHHFSSDILVPFPDSSDLYSRDRAGNLGQQYHYVARNFCPWPDPLYDERHENSGILMWNWQQKAFLGCRIITSENPLLQYYSPSVVFSSRKNSHLS